VTESKAPRFDEYAHSFLLAVQHPNTQKRCRSSVHNLTACFGNVKPSDITPDVIEDFKERRLSGCPHRNREP
jgi:hypothetical protein